MLSFDRLKQVLDYNPTSGIFTWKHRCDAPKWWNTKYAGKTAGSIEGGGYLMTAIDGRSYSLHRLAWFYVHGDWPRNQIDHINVDKTDNSIGNLREATQSQNCSNTRIYTNNTSGVKGVSFAKRERKWKAYVRNDKTLIHLGYFDHLEDAITARRIAAMAIQGEFMRE